MDANHNQGESSTQSASIEPDDEDFLVEDVDSDSMDQLPASPPTPPPRPPRQRPIVIHTDSSDDEEEPPARRRRLNALHVQEPAVPGSGPSPVMFVEGPMTRSRRRELPARFPDSTIITLDDHSNSSDSSSSSNSDVQVLGEVGRRSSSPRFSSSESGSGVEFSPDDDEEEGSQAQANNSNNWRAQRLVRRNAIVLRDEDDDEEERRNVQEIREALAAEFRRRGMPVPGSAQVQVHQPAVEVEQDADEDDRTTEEEGEGDSEGHIEEMPPPQQVNVRTEPSQQPTEASGSQSSSSSTNASAATAAGSSATTLDDEDDSSTCLICCEPFTNSGPHRLTCLKCGHTYGKACIEKWLTSNTRCPQCNARASRRDVRVIYVKNLRALDTAERDRALEQLEKEKEAKRRLELELAMLRQKNLEREAEMNQLKVEHQYMRTRVGGIYRTQEAEAGPSHLQPKSGPSSGANSLFYSKLKHIQFPGECRVGVFNQWLNMIAVSNSCKSPLYVNGVHSIRRINLLDFSQPVSIPIHQKEIRDMAFSPAQSDTLLSVGLDKRAVLTNCNSNVVIQSYGTESPLWSCTWNGANQYGFFIGSQGGQIQEYDLRRPNELLGTTEVGSDNVPIVRLIYINPSYKDKVSGLLIQKLNSIWYWPKAGGAGAVSKDYQQLPLEGPFVSVAWEPSTRHLLVTTRGKAGGGGVGRHLICDLRQQEGDSNLRCEVVESLENPIYLSKMTRSAIYTPRESEPPSPVHIAANGANKTVSIWNLTDKSWKQNVLVPEPVLDFIPCNLNGGHLLGMVGAESGVQFYKG